LDRRIVNGAGNAMQDWPGVMDRAAWRLRHFLARLGWPGMAGLVLLAAAAACCAFTMAASLAERDRLAEQAAQLRARYRMAQASPRMDKPGPERQLQSFHEFFPAMSSLPDWLAGIAAAARKTGLVLDLGQYRIGPERGTRLLRYQLTLPVKGDYEQIRDFIGAVLRDVPAAGLDDVALKREAIGSEILEARIRLSLFLAAPQR